MIKKICFISPSLIQGGLENAVMVIANEMASRGHEVSIICVYNNPIFYDLDVSINVIFPPYNREGFSTLLYYWKSAKYIREQVKTVDPDVIVSYGDYINFISILATRNLKIPVFVSDRSSPDKPFPFLVAQLRKYSYSFAQGIMAQTERAKQQKQTMLGGKYDNIQIVPNALRTITNYPEIEKENIVLGVGRHYHVKGLDLLIEAFAQSPKESWKLMIAGSYGPETESLKTLVKKLNIESRVTFLGPVKEIDKVYSQAKIFVLSSRSEGFPNALIESMAHGLACISFDVSAGPSDIINNLENGILVEEGNISELSRQIDFLISNLGKREELSQNAGKIKEKLSVQKIGDIFYNFITIK